MINNYFQAIYDTCIILILHAFRVIQIIDINK